MKKCDNNFKKNEDVIVFQNKKRKKPYSLSAPLMLLITTLGPIGWFIIDIIEKRTERLIPLFITSIILVVLDTISWCVYFSKNNTFELDDE